MSVARGQVWSVTLDPTVANEQRGTRPCVVVSIDRFGQFIGTATSVTIAAITTQLLLWFGHHGGSGPG